MPAAIHVPTQREHVTSSPTACRRSPVCTGSSSPAGAVPCTKGSRRKLVTSSRASVRDALKVARPSTARSKAVRSGGVRCSFAARAPVSATPPRKVDMIPA